jgi:hypothetical protein
LGKFFGEWNAYEVLDSLIFQQLCFLFKGVEQFQAVIFGMQDEPGVWPVRYYYCLTKIPRRDFAEPRKDSLMADMNTIESTTGDNGVLKLRKIIDTVVDLHFVVL